MQSYPQQETESKAEDKTEAGEEPDDLYALLTLEPDEFAQGIARLVEYAMTNREKKPSILNAMLGTGTSFTAEPDHITSLTVQ